jgi:lipopolysaccharide export system protein LptA
VATSDFAQQEMQRRKRMAGLVAGGLAATLVTVALAYWWSKARTEKPLPVPEALPTNVNQQASGYSFTRSVEGRKIFTVHAARTVAFKQGGTTVLQEVTVEVFGREGNRHDVLRTHRCEYNPQSGDFSSPGSVEIELNAPGGGLPDASRGLGSVAGRGAGPVLLETSRVSFRQQGSLAVTDEPVRFRVGSATGSARGMKYATQGGWVELEKDVVLELHPRSVSAAPSAPAGMPAPSGASQQVPVRLTASHLRYESAPGQGGTTRLEGPLEIVQANRRVVSERGMVSLDGRNRITRAVLEGNVRAFDSSGPGGEAMKASAERLRGEFDPASGQLRALVAEGNVTAESHRGGLSRLEAQQVEVTFQGAHPRPQAGNASGDVRLALDSFTLPTSGLSRRTPQDKSPRERKTLSAGEVRFACRPDGKSLSEMQTVGPGQIEVAPVDPSLGEREITAGQFLMAFDTRSRLETLRGLARTRMVFHPAQSAPPGTSAQESSSEQLEATFDPSTQTLEQLEQVGDFRFRDGDRQASAERAAYSPSTQVLTLTGHPQVWDATTRTSAQSILFNLGAGRAEGAGEVQSTQFAGSKETGDPTHILADRMVAEKRSQFVHYEGRVRAWHGTDVLESSSLDVWRTQGRVSSGLRVLSSHFQPAALTSEAGANSTPRAEAGTTRPMTIRADHLDYLDAGHKASYRGNVQLQTENTTLQADHVDLYFSNTRTGGASEIDRAVADGHVTVTQPMRHASGEHAEYYAAPAKIQLTGGPPRLEDEEKGSVTGQRLTFFVHDDRLLVDGGDQFPTLSKHRVAP